LESRPSQTKLRAPATDPIHREFRRAVREGQGIARLRYLLDRGADIDSRDGINRTPLYHAAFKGDHEAVQLLLQNGADMNAQDDIVGTPICVAALKAHEKVVEVLLEHNASVAGSYGKALGSPMHCACFGGSVRIFQCILASGGSLGHMSIVSVSALSEMAKERWPRSRSMQTIVSGKQYAPGYRFIECSPIFLAAECCHFDILRLCWAPTDVAVSFSTCSPDDPCWRFSQVHVSSQIQASPNSVNRSYNLAQHASGLSNISSRGSSSSAWSFMGFSRPPPIQPTSTLLMWAAGSLNLDLIDHLFKSGASVDREDTHRKTALHYAASPFENARFRDVGRCVKRLMESASYDTVYGSISTGRDCNSPLLLVVDSEHVALDPRIQHTWGSDIHDRCVAAFIDNMTPMSHRSAASHEALFRALSRGTVDRLDPEVFERLCKNDAVLCEKPQYTEELMRTVSKRGWPCHHVRDALQEALANGAHAPIVAILLKHKCDPNSLDRDDCTPLLTAIENKANADVISILVDHGADPDLQSGFDLTPRLFAEQLGRYDLDESFNRNDDALEPGRKNLVQSVSNATFKPSSRRWLHKLPMLSFMKSKKAM
jgi:ankyrin repeat protein